MSMRLLSVSANLPLLLSPPPPPFPAPIALFLASPTRSRTATALRASSMASPVSDFPYLPPAHRQLMTALVSDLESRLAPSLLPSDVPPDVLAFRNDLGTSLGALDIRSGAPGSSIDFILESWLHCEVPTGALNITTLFAFLNSSTDAPHLLMEFIQGSPTSLVLFMDLLPRKDLVLYPDYLDDFYQSTNLDKQRQELEKIPGVLPYRSSSLYIRSVLSPTAIALHINCVSEGPGAMEEIMAGHLDFVAKEVLRIWLDKCASSSEVLEEAERGDLIKRDNLIKNKTIEIDLSANLPRLFGPDVAGTIVATIQKAFRI